MKILFSASLMLAACCVAASAITVKTPADGAHVTSPFLLDASTNTCGSVQAVAMGYSIDTGTATIEPTSFSTSVQASPGAHVLHVKCWGRKVHAEVLLNITVVSSGASITVATPANGAGVTSPFRLVASTSRCGSVPAVSMGYSLDSGPAVIEPISFSTMVSASSGAHILHVKCWGQKTHEQVLLDITVAASTTAATPQLSLPSGRYTNRQVLSMSDATPGAAIYYTTDGSGPSTSSFNYSAPITISRSTVVEAIAVAPGLAHSGLAMGDYVIGSQSGPSIPSNAIAETQVQRHTGWRIKHDPATSGTASGAMSVISNPSLSGYADGFETTYTDWGGVLYSVTYAKDPNPANFVYDAHVWIASGSKIGNLEMDNNQVIANGDTIIYAFQCAGDTNTWDYSENAGTRTSPVVHWVQSKAPCNPADWTPDAWHHVQISYSRDNAGNVIYHSVWLDGVESPINETVNSDFALRWTPGILVANFQVDGVGASGSSTLYLDDLTIYRW